MIECIYPPLIRLDQELAGLGGSVSFHKHQIELQQSISLPLLPNFSLQGTFRAGILKHVGNSPNYIMDRFFIGGPLNIRGFRTYQIGPQSSGNFLGATTFWTSGLHLYTPLPFMPKDSLFHEYMRTHSFITAGNIGNFSFTGDHYKNLQILQSCCRISAGFGLVISLHEMARLELHYALPIAFQPGDKPKKGFQMGIGVEFV